MAACAGEAEKLQRPVVFTAHHETVALSEEGTVATKDDRPFQSAVCGGYEMRRGQHYATFTLHSGGYACLGVVGAGFNPSDSDVAFESPQGWMLDTFDGDLWHANHFSVWEGQPASRELKQGDVVVRWPSPLSNVLCDSRCARSVRCRACCSTSTRRP